MTRAIIAKTFTVFRSAIGGRQTGGFLSMASINMDIKRNNSSASEKSDIICRRLVGKVAVVTASTEG